IQAATSQSTASGITPGHHLLLHLKRPCIRRPEDPEPRENKPLRGCQTRNNTEQSAPRKATQANRLCSDHRLTLLVAAKANHARMKQLRHSVIRAGLEALYFTGAHYLLRPIFA